MRICDKVTLVPMATKKRAATKKTAAKKPAADESAGSVHAVIRIDPELHGLIKIIAAVEGVSQKEIVDDWCWDAAERWQSAKKMSFGVVRKKT